MAKNILPKYNILCNKKKKSKATWIKWDIYSISILFKIKTALSALTHWCRVIALPTVILFCEFCLYVDDYMRLVTKESICRPTKPHLISHSLSFWKSVIDSITVISTIIDSGIIIVLLSILKAKRNKR